MFAGSGQSKIRTSLVVYLILFQLFAPVPSAHAGPREICEKILGLVVDTGNAVGWVFTKPVDHSQPHRYALPRFSPSRLEGVGQTGRLAWRLILDTVDGNVLTRLFTAGERDSRFLTALAFAVFLGMPALKAGWDQADYWKAEGLVEEKPHLYDERLETDPRFAFIEDARDAGVMTPHEARMATYRLLEGKFGIKPYYEKIRPQIKIVNDAFNPPLTDDLRIKILQSALFQDPSLQNLLIYGIQPGAGFDVDSDRVGELSVEQVDQLILNRVRLYDRLFQLDEMFRGSAEFKAIADRPDVMANVKNATDNDEFISGIRSSHNERLAAGKKGLYSPKEFHEYVLENEVWKSTYQAWQDLGMRPKVELGDEDGDGRHTLIDMQMRRTFFLFKRP